MKLYPHRSELMAGVTAQSEVMVASTMPASPSRSTLPWRLPLRTPLLLSGTVTGCTSEGWLLPALARARLHWFDAEDFRRSDDGRGCSTGAQVLGRLRSAPTPSRGTYHIVMCGGVGKIWTITPLTPTQVDPSCSGVTNANQNRHNRLRTPSTRCRASLSTASAIARAETPRPDTQTPFPGARASPTNCSAEIMKILIAIFVLLLAPAAARGEFTVGNAGCTVFEDASP